MGNELECRDFVLFNEIVSVCVCVCVGSVLRLVVFGVLRGRRGVRRSRIAPTLPNLRCVDNP